MPKNCVITLDETVVDRASENAHKLGKNLKGVIEDAIISMATSETDGPWITERILETLSWAPSRVSLYQMRKDGRLVPGKHYKREGRFIYYHKAELLKVLTPAAVPVKAGQVAVPQPT